MGEDTEGMHEVDAEPWLAARVTWTPRRGGESVTVTGDFLEDTATTPVLTCGIYAACEALRLPEPDDHHALLVSRLVDRQLQVRRWAVLWCALGHFRIEVEP